MTTINTNNKKRKADDFYYTKTENDCVYFFRNGKLHRTDGPAIIGANRVWYQDGQVHRTDGPAVEYSNGMRVYYQYDQVHREDGPAVIHPCYTTYYLFGKEINRHYFYSYIRVIKRLQRLCRKRYYTRYTEIITDKLSGDLAEYTFKKYIVI